MAKKQGWEKGLGKFTKNDDMPVRPGPGDDPEAPAEDYSKVTYADNTRPAFPRGKNG